MISRRLERKTIKKNCYDIIKYLHGTEGKTNQWIVCGLTNDVNVNVALSPQI